MRTYHCSQSVSFFVSVSVLNVYFLLRVRRLINLVAEDNAIEDTIYHLHRALNTGRIDLERFLRVCFRWSHVQPTDVKGCDTPDNSGTCGRTIYEKGLD